MKTYPVTLLEIGLLSGTRATAAGGLALVISQKLNKEQNKAIGWTLFGFGTIFYLAFLLDVVLRNKSCQPPPAPPK